MLGLFARYRGRQAYDAFLDKFAERTAKLTVGPPDDPTNYMGPVISASARKTILDYIETGKREGRSGRRSPPVPGDGYFIPPTVIADVDAGARIFQEEIFGPVLAVTKARDFEHALELANDSVYGLTGAIYSHDREHLERAARAILRRQSVSEPEMHRRHGRRASFWRIQSVGHRFESGRTRLSATILTGQVDC